MNEKLAQKSLEIAFALFEKDYELRCQVFSFLFFKRKLIVVGRNKKKSHPLHLRNYLKGRDGEIIADKSICAEFHGINKVKNLTNIPYHKLSIYNVRIDRERKVKNSCPCFSCRNLFLALDISEIYHTTDSGQFEEYKP